jgi:signal transduction histidine kinase
MGATDSPERGADTNAGERRPGIPSSVVHELRTPLTAIHGYAQLLKRSSTDAAIAERAVDVILRESARLGSLLNQIYEVAELEAGRVTIQPVKANLSDVARSAAQQIARDVAKHELVVDASGDVECTCDPRRVSQVLTHVLSNAISYSPEGGRVTIGLERQAGEVHITVADPGIGIPPEDADRIYERHYRGQNAQRIGVRGLGLGLYVTREITQRLGGRVWHEPREGGGTIFHLVVPDA